MVALESCQEFLWIDTATSRLKSGHFCSDLFCLSHWCNEAAAQCGLVAEDQVIPPYNQTLKEMNRQQLNWAFAVLVALGRECDLSSDRLILLAGNRGISVWGW